MSESRLRWFLRTPGGLARRCAETSAGGDLIEGILPARALGIVVGDSGLGKSPLLYQAAICVATGLKFLGYESRLGTVLYFDFENGLREVSALVSHLARYLGLNEDPKNLYLWNFNDCSLAWGQPGETVMDVIRDVKPALAIIDSLGDFCPGVEDRNSDVIRTYQQLRETIRETGTTIVGVHHIRKSSTNPKDPPEPLDGNLRRWFLQARGPRALINGSDVRLGIDEPSLKRVGRTSWVKPRASVEQPGEGESRTQIALALRGFARLRGEIPLTYLARVSDDEGEPLGYSRMAGPQLLFNDLQEEAFASLPNEFRTKQAKQTYDRDDEATALFLKKCIAIGILKKASRGIYVKALWE
jgi:hypothetical protein